MTRKKISCNLHWHNLASQSKQPCFPSAHGTLNRFRNYSNEERHELGNDELLPAHDFSFEDEKKLGITYQILRKFVGVKKSPRGWCLSAQNNEVNV